VDVQLHYYLVITVPPYIYLILMMQDSHLSTPFDMPRDALGLGQIALGITKKVSIYGADMPYLFHATTHIAPPLPSTHA